VDGTLPNKTTRFEEGKKSAQAGETARLTPAAKKPEIVSNTGPAGSNIAFCNGSMGQTYKIKKYDGYSIITLQPDSNKTEEAYTDFISTISHELRTPLTSIRGFADTLLSSSDKLDTAQIQKFLTIIKEQSNRLIKLIENLLSVSRLHSNHENYVYKAVDVRLQTERILPMMKDRYKNHIFEFKCRNPILPVLADENKFQQIMINLLENAAKYSDENSLILIEAADSKTENYVEITVKDTGCGIAEEYIGKIFEKFSRIENPLTRKEQGSGLGLYIVKNLVEKMNGKITVESTLKKGSAFTVSFPAANYTTQSDKKILEKD
jgi:signal transduction histidine kinase